jgi:iron complex outermembrane receptor protein
VGHRFLASIVCLSLCSVGWALDLDSQQQFDIPAQKLSTALVEFSRQTKTPIVSSTPDVERFNSPGVTGRMSLKQALRTLLQGTGLDIRTTDNGAIAVGIFGAKPLLEPESDGKTSSLSHASNLPMAAAPSPDSERAALSEIIVTAQRRSERLQDVPMSITALSGQELASRGATDINDIVANTPGFYNTAAGYGAQNNLVIRAVTTGVGVSLAQSTVSLMLDDIDLNPGASTFTNADPRIIDVQRVEVLRGPQGTLFGAGSLSGTVRFIANKPDLDNLSGSVEVTGSSTENGGNSGDVSGVLNIPLIEGKLAARVVAYDYDDAGWVDDPSRGVSNVNGSRTDGVRLLVNAKPTDEISLLFTAIDERAHDLGSSATYYYPQPGPEGPQYVQPHYDVDWALTNTHIYDFVATWQPSWGTLTSTTNYYDRPSSLYEDLGAFLPLIGLAAPGSNAPAPTTTPNTIHDVSQELRFETPQLDSWHLTAGAFYQRIASDPTEIATTLVPGVPLLLNATGTDVQWQAALFGSGTYTLADRLDFTAGVRVSHDEVNFTTVESGLLAGAPTVGRETDRPVTPRFALTFRQTRDLTWYLQAAKGYRVGGPNMTAGNNGALASYQPDSLWNYEVGSKVRLFDGALNLNTSLYDIEWSHMQVALVTPAGFSYLGNGGNARIYGLEEEATWRPMRWLEVGGTLSIDHAATTSAASIERISYGDYGPSPTFEPTAATQNGVLSGYRLPGSPQLQGSLYGQGDFHVWGHDAYTRISGQYVGAAYTDFDSQGLKFGDYAIANARLGLKLSNCEIIGFIDNFLNSDGRTAAQDETPFFVPTAYRVRPRTVGVTLRADF